MDIKAVRKRKRLALSKIGFDTLLIKSCLLFVIDQDHNDVSDFCSFGAGHNLQALCFCLCPAFRAFVKANNHIYPAVLQIKSVSMSLRAITNNCNGLAVEFLKVAILLIKNSRHNNYLFLFYRFMVCRIVVLPFSRDTLPVRQISRIL